ncbi:sulfite exporter TauE/SafE family protein [Kitasatospora cinereorecta]
MTALLLALAAGAVVGLALGALGGGGSMLAVPALIYLLHLDPATATTAALLIVAVTTLTALPAHARARRVRWRTGLLFAAAGLPAATLGGALSRYAPPAALTAGFAGLAALAAWRMLGPRRPAPPPAAPAAPGPAPAPSPTRSLAVGAALGLATGLLGVGGGFLAVPALVSLLALPMTEAVATSLLVIGANSLAALVPRLGSAGHVPWTVVGPFAAAAILGAWDGKRLAARLGGRTLQRVFAAALLSVATLMLADAILH